MPETTPKPVFQVDASAISPERVERAIMQRYSPLPDLTMATLAAQLNAFRIGDLRQAARTWEIMMERDGDLAVPAEKLFSDIARLPWEIEKEDDSAEAEADAAFLKYFYTNLTATSILEQSETGGFNLLARQIMTAHAFRYSAHEMVLQVNSAAKREVTAQFNHCPVWFFENRKGRLAFLQNEADMIGEPCELGRWLTAVGRGHMRQCAIAYFCKWGPLSDWMFFAKRFGLPAIHGETSATKDSAEWNDFAAALQEFANGWILQTSGMGNSKVSLIEAAKGASGTLPFKDLVERSDRVYARCFRGGDLSTQSRDGTNVAGANPQESEKRIILEDGGRWLSDILNARVDEPMIAYAFNRRPKAWICVRPPKESDSTREINTLKAAKELGIPVSIETGRERLELPAPEDGEPMISGGAAVNPNVPADPNQPDGAAPAPGATSADVQATALNGAQVNALAELANNVALGVLPLATAQAIAVAAFPLVAPAIIAKIFSPLRNFTPEQPATPAQAQPAVAQVRALANSVGPNQAVTTALTNQISPLLAVLERISRISDDAAMQAALENFLAQSDRFAALAKADATRVQQAVAQTVTPAFTAALKGKSPA